MKILLVVLQVRSAGYFCRRSLLAIKFICTGCAIIEIFQFFNHSHCFLEYCNPRRWPREYHWGSNIFPLFSASLCKKKSVRFGDSELILKWTVSATREKACDNCRDKSFYPSGSVISLVCPTTENTISRVWRAICQESRGLPDSRWS